MPQQRSRQTLHVVLGAHTLWWRLEDEQRCYKPRRHRWTPEALIQELRGLTFRRLVLLLESPWLLTQQRVGISLSPQELPSFVRQQLQPPPVPEGAPEPFPLIGVARSPQGGAESVTYLCVGATAAALDLKQALEQEFGRPVHLHPLLGLLLESLPEAAAEAWALHGLEDWYYLEPTSPEKKLVPMPKLAEEQLAAWAEDVQGCQELSLLKLRPRRPEAPQERSCVSFSDALEHLPAWEASFRWLDSVPQKSGWWREGALLAVGLVLLGVWGALRWVPEAHLKALDQDLKRTEQQLAAYEQRRAALQEAQQQQGLHERLAAVEARIAEQQAWLPPELLDSLLAPLSLAWLEAVHYEGHLLQLELLTLRESNIPRLLRQLEAHPRVQAATLTHQDYKRLEQRSVVHMRVQLKLTPPSSPEAR